MGGRLWLHPSRHTCYLYAGWRVRGGRRKTRAIALHRIVMRDYLGRPLQSWEHVHHRDGNGLNNELSNLQLLSADAHNEQTLVVRPWVVVCLECRRPFMRRHGKSPRYCSHSCAAFAGHRQRREQRKARR